MMFKIFFTALVLLVSVQAQTVLAHASGHGPVSDVQAMMIASDVAEQFTLQDPGLGFGKLSASWSSLPSQAKRVHKKDDGYYIIALENRAEKKTLYLLMSIEGEVFDANLNGDFPGLKQ